MWAFLRDWYRRRFHDPEVVVFTFTFFSSVVVLYVLVRTVPAVVGSIVMAYLLESLVARLEARGLKRVWGATFVVAGSAALVLLVLLGLLPLSSRQLAELFGELPTLAARVQQLLSQLSDMYPAIFDPQQVAAIHMALRSQLTRLGQSVLGASLGFLPNLITLLVYAVLIPLLVFFMLKDKEVILAWVRRFLPRERRLAAAVWAEVDGQLGNYARGKLLEMMIVGVAATIMFLLLGLNYAVLLGIFVGLSVLVPFVGATVMTVPVFLVAYLQWGWTGPLAWTLIAYAILQALDGNLLVPLLFSEIVNLHPIAIVVAVLFFGNLWGIWGVFFAIPLATVVKALLAAWPSHVGGEVEAGGPSLAPTAPTAPGGAPAETA